jgi:IPT/TIG domain
MRTLLPVVALAICSLLAVAGPAGAATPPVITKVKPMTAGIGDTLTLTGKNFRKGTGKNTVVFKADGSKAVFLKAGDSSSTRMKVTLTQKLRPFLVTKDGQPQPTRFRLRVLSSRFGTKFTPTRLSPLIGADPKQVGGLPGTGTVVPPPPPPPDCDGDGQADAVDTDDDNDLLSDAEETQTFKTDVCNRDTDGDGVWDVYEVESALDMNSRAVAYPYKVSYPNALDGKDANIDFDGDSLTLREEFQLWDKFGNRSRTLNYSDGKQRTAPVLQGTPNAFGEKYPVSDAAKAALCPNPADTDRCLTANEIARYIDWNRDGILGDEERDADGDGLSNFQEAHGALSSVHWWTSVPDYSPEKPYMNTYVGTSFVDPDTDGDGLLDGADDQDLDLWPNAYESSRGAVNYGWDVADASIDGDGLDENPLGKVNPFNPCLPAEIPPPGQDNHCALIRPVGVDWEHPDPGTPQTYKVADPFLDPLGDPFPNPPLP